MPHTLAEKKKALVRTRRIRGQVDGLERALEASAECGTVLQQLAAIRGAVNGLMSELLQSHIREQFGASLEGDKHSKSVREITQLVRTYLK